MAGRQATWLHTPAVPAMGCSVSRGGSGNTGGLDADGTAADHVSPGAAPTRTRAPGLADGASAIDPTTRAAFQPRDPARYRIFGEHARGGLGRVLRAHDVELGRQVAIKELLERTPVAELRFIREALITSRLAHPGIVRVHEAGRWSDGTPFYVMEFVNGQPLRDLITPDDPIQSRLSLLSNIVAVADAMAFAHERGVIHRDLKPSNIIVGSFGETVVIDWGLARTTYEDDAIDPLTDGRPAPAAGLTAAGTFLGTPAYMAPEQRDGKASLSSDVYALGRVLLHIVAGAPPPPETGAQSEPRLPPDTPRDLAAIIHRAVAFSPSDRYTSARELADDLRRYLAKDPVTARSYSVFEKARLALARHRDLSFTATLALTALVAVLGAAIYRIRSERDLAIASQASAEAASARASIAERRTVTALDDIRLSQARLLLSSDPTEALRVAGTYSGSDALARDLIVAEARANALTQLEVTPHHQAIRLIATTPTGVLSVALDGSVTATTPSGQMQVVVPAGIQHHARAYSAANHVLAVGCDPDDLCLWNLENGRPMVFTGAEAAHVKRPEGVAFSPDGRRLAVLTRGGVLSVWKLDSTSATLEASSPGFDVSVAFEVSFLDAASVAIVAPDWVNMARVAGTRIEPSRVPLPGAGTMARLDDIATMVYGTRSGAIALVPFGAKRPIETFTACSTPVIALVALPPSKIGFACQDSTGVYDTQRHETVTRRPNPHAVTAIAASADGHYMATGDSTGLVVIFDTRTGLTHELRGHKSRISAVCVDQNALVASGDSGGNLRTWALPTARARVVAKERAQVIDLFPLDEGFVLSSLGAGLQVWSAGAFASTPLTPHVRENSLFMRSPDGRLFTAFGKSSFVEVWDVQGRLRRRLATPQASVEDAMVIEGEQVATAGEDGSLLLWPSDSNEARELFRAAGGLVRTVALPHGRGFVTVPVADPTIAWFIVDGAPPARVAKLQGAIVDLRVSADGTLVLLATSTGQVVVYGTRDWSVVGTFQVTGPVRTARFSPNGEWILVATRDTSVHLLSTRGARVPWSRLEWSARGAEFDESGTALMIAREDGLAWIYDFPSETWTATALGATAPVFEVPGRHPGLWFVLTDNQQVVQVAK